MSVMTDREWRVLQFIRERVVEDGHSPSVREIRAALDISSTSLVNRDIAQLVEYGAIEKRGETARSMRPTGARTILPGEPVTVRTEGGELVTGELIAGATA